MNKFKVGDRVRITSSDDYINQSGHPIGHEYTIKEIYNENRCRKTEGVATGVRYDGLELVEPKTVSLTTTVDNVVGTTKDYFTQEEINEMFNTQYNKLLTLNSKKMTTLQQELFERFLKTNKTKIIDAAETGNENVNRFTGIINGIDLMLQKYRSIIGALTAAYDNQDKGAIEYNLTEVNKFNKIFKDDMFNQLSAISDIIMKTYSS